MIVRERVINVYIHRHIIAMRQFSFVVCFFSFISCSTEMPDGKILSRTAAQALPAAVMPQKEEQRLAEIRAAGLQGDSSNTVTMMAALSGSSNPDYKKTIIQALARLGAINAKSVINAEITKEDTDTGNFARVAQARLVAESETRTEVNGSQAADKIQRFMQELGLTASEINDAVAHHYEIGGKTSGLTW